MALLAGRWWPCPALLLLLGCDVVEIAGSARFREDFHYTYALKPGGRLSVENFNGSVEVRAWDKDEVDISGTKYASSEELLAALTIDVVATENFIQVRTVRPSGRRGNMGAKYVILAPRRIELDRIQSSNGSLTIEGLEGDARLKSSNGAIRVTDLSGDIEAETSNAAIELWGCDGSAVLDTSNGGIKADRVRGHFEATTSNAGVEATVAANGDSRPIRVRSSNGSVRLRFEQLPATDVYVTTSNAPITVSAPAALAVRLRASTSNAAIHTDFDVFVEAGQVGKSQLRGAIGGGGPLLELTTSNAGIQVKKL